MQAAYHPHRQLQRSTQRNYYREHHRRYNGYRDTMIQKHQPGFIQLYDGWQIINWILRKVLKRLCIISEFHSQPIDPTRPIRMSPLESHIGPELLYCTKFHARLMLETQFRIGTENQ